MSSIIQLFIGPDLAGCLAMQAAPSISPQDEVVLLPSTLSRRDGAAAQLRSWLRTHDVTSRLLIPESLVASTFVQRGSLWSSVEAERTGETFRLPTRLAIADVVWTVSDIDAVGGRGPYVLDLPVRYSNLTSRLKVLGSPDRAARSVSFLRARPLAAHLIVRRFPAFTLLATTTDPIVAELFSLSLVDEELSVDTQVIGPWEDEFVQRATELELGARLPSEIRLIVHGNRHAAIDATIGRVAARMGVHNGQVMHAHQE